MRGLWPRGCSGCARGDGPGHEEVHCAQVLLGVPAQEVALQELQPESPRGGCLGAGPRAPPRPGRCRGFGAGPAFSCMRGAHRRSGVPEIGRCCWAAMTGPGCPQDVSGARPLCALRLSGSAVRGVGVVARPARACSEGVGPSGRAAQGQRAGPECGAAWPWARSQPPEPLKCCHSAYQSCV